jgi:hypothetical protein
MTPFRDYSDNELFSPTFSINRPAPVQQVKRKVVGSNSKVIKSYTYKDGSSSQLVKSRAGKYSVLYTSPNESTRVKLKHKTLQGARKIYEKYNKV